MAILDLIAQPEDVKVASVGVLAFFTGGGVLTGGYLSTNSSYSFRLREPLPSAQTSFWFHARINTNDTNTGDGSSRIRFVDTASGDSQIEFTRGDNVGTWRVRRRDSGGSLTNVGPSLSISQGVWLNLDIEYVVHASTGSIKIYLDEVLAASYTGDTSIDAGSWDDIIFESAIFDNMNYAEIIISTTSTLGMRLAALHPDGNGNHTDWSGSYTDVDEVDYNAGDFASTNAANQSTTYTMSATPTEVDDKNIVFVRATGSIFSDTTYDVEPLMRIGTTTYAGSTVSLASGVNYVKTDYTISPASSAPFTVSELDGLEVGFKSV